MEMQNKLCFAAAVCMDLGARMMAGRSSSLRLTSTKLKTLADALKRRYAPEQVL